MSSYLDADVAAPIRPREPVNGSPVEVHAFGKGQPLPEHFQGGPDENAKPLPADVFESAMKVMDLERKVSALEEKIDTARDLMRAMSEAHAKNQLLASALSHLEAVLAEGE